MSFNRSQVGLLNTDDGYDTYGYDDQPIPAYCTAKKQDVQITIMYRGTNPSMTPLITLYQCNNGTKKFDEKTNFNLCANDRNCTSYCECHECLCTCGKVQKWKDSTGLDHHIEQENNQNPPVETINLLTESLIWKDLFPILDDFGFFGFTNDPKYITGKEKILKGKFNDVSKEEYTEILGALKSAESKLCSSPIQQHREKAYLIRRIVFHGREIGCNGFAQLKDKYGGCYIATVAYGSYDSPQVKILRNFRDNYLEKRVWGRKFVQLYYKFSPSLASKLQYMPRINSIIRNILNVFIYFLKDKFKSTNIS